MITSCVSRWVHVYYKNVWYFMFNLVWWLMLSALCLLWIVICKSRAESGQPGTESHRSINVVLWNYCTRHTYNNKEMLNIWSPSETVFLGFSLDSKDYQSHPYKSERCKALFPLFSVRAWHSLGSWCSLMLLRNDCYVLPGFSPCSFGTYPNTDRKVLTHTRK